MATAIYGKALGQGKYCVFDHYYDVAVDRSSFNFIDWEGAQRLKSIQSEGPPCCQLYAVTRPSVLEFLSEQMESTQRVSLSIFPVAWLFSSF